MLTRICAHHINMTIICAICAIIDFIRKLLRNASFYLRILSNLSALSAQTYLKQKKRQRMGPLERQTNRSEPPWVLPDGGACGE